VTSPTGCFRRSPGLRLRPVPELDTCLVYRPRPPKLFRLSLSAWLVLELCDGLDDAQLGDAYRRAAGNRMNGEQAARQARQGLEMLIQNGLVHTAAGQ
jgi:hypothetical protein